jgi:crossover junction endodeoxyribonuclease RusA
MFKFEFKVTGIPISLQCQNRASLQRWKAEVNSAARQRWPSGLSPQSGDLKIHITYYFDGSHPDVDNIIKPIQDALKGLIYEDDHQIVSTHCNKKDINGSYKIRNANPLIVEGFSKGEDFLYILIEEYQDREALT